MNGQTQANPTTTATAASAASGGARLSREFEATLGARQELGGRYDEELIDDFLRRLDQSVDAHIEERVTQQRTSRPGSAPGRKARPRHLRLLIAALVLAVPLLAGSASFGAFMGLLFGIASHHVIVGLATAFLVTVGTFSAVALVLAVGALIYLDRRRS